MSLGAGFLCDCIVFSKILDVFTPAFKNQELPNKNSSLSPFDKPEDGSNTRRVLLHGWPWLGLRWGFPVGERGSPMCMHGCHLAGYTTLTCLVSCRDPHIDLNAEERVGTTEGAWHAPRVRRAKLHQI